MRIVWRMAALAALVLSAGCDEKDSDFFTTVVGGGDGTLGLAVHGTPAGATVTVQRNGNTVFSGVVGSTSHILEGLAFGAYEVTITPPDGYDCGTTTVPVAIGEITPDPDVVYTCTLPTGSFAMTLSGVNSNMQLAIGLDGPADRTGQLGITGTTFTGLLLGSYAWSYPQPDGYLCSPATGEFTLAAAGQQAEAAVECAPSEGALRVTVSGSSATIAYTGPENGGGSVGSTPVDFTGLTPGNYTVSITEPADTDCSPSSQPAAITAGATTSVQFVCEPEEVEEELVEYSVDLAGFQGAPGAVPAGAYQRAVRDALLVAVATMTINTIGTQTFFGTSPDRLGFNGTSGYELDVLFPVAALFFRIRAMQICTINAALSGSNFLGISYYTAALVLIGTASITGSPGCFWLDVPLGARYIRMLGPAVGFVDIHNLLLRGVLAP